MRYRIALFDADNTLLDFSRSEYEALTDCLIARGLPHDRTVTGRYSVINDEQWKLLERGLTTRDVLRVERFAILAREFGFDLDPVRMARDYVDALSTKAYMMEGAEDLCRALYGHCRMYIVTNGVARVQNERFNVTPLAPLFDGVFISEDVGCAKPDPAFFAYIASAVPQFDPHEAIIIGDSLTSDMQGGINAGIDTCWFNPTGKTVPADMPITYTVSSLNAVEVVIRGT